MRVSRGGWLRFAVLAALLCAPAPTDAAEPHRAFRAFYPSGEYDLVIGQAKVEAELLFSQRAAAYLLKPKGDERTFLLLQRKRAIATVEGDWIRRENGDVDLPKSAAPQTVGRIALSGQDIVLRAPNLNARLKPRAPLLGYHGAKAVLAHSPQYGLVMRGYRPDPGALARLKDAKDVKVETIFGSWCPRCQQTVGYVLQIEKALAAKGVQFTYYGLPNPPKAWKNERFIVSKAKALPTALVFVNDKLAGRIAPTEWKGFETRLARIVNP
ncbi:MAG: thioredoxin family protein [Planctomycetota bacterium]|nr:thioredoxin family protein [Planctomycetota bacterium]